MSNYPNAYDDDSTLPPVNDNLTELGGEAINDLRDAVMQIELALGLNIAGSAPNLATRLGVFINPDGSPNTSIIYSLGLVTLPITNVQIANNAGIPESKLALDYPTQNLFNYIRDLAKDVNLTSGWISVTGIKLEPHLMGAIYRHDLAQIDVAEVSTQFLNNVFRVNRNNTDSYTMISDLNNELLDHQWADGSTLVSVQNIITNSGAFYPSNYAHVASGIYVDTSGFGVIPQTDNSLQAALEFIDSSSTFLFGSRITNFYANGISVNSRASSLPLDGYGPPIVPNTPAIAYLKGMGNQTSPIDNFQTGDDIVQFFPTSNATFSFDSQFSQVRVGDILRVNYAADGYPVVIQSVISEIKNDPGVMWAVRIAGKNITYSPHAVARIDRPLFNNNKYGVLATANVDTSPITSQVSGPVLPSLVIGSPRGAQCLGVDFNPEEFNETHYLLYLALYSSGNPLTSVITMVPIDVTGNAGITPGNYTLQSIVDATNQAFRQPGYNYRFIAFSHQGQFGIMLADPFNNASFSVISGSIDPGTGNIIQTAYPNNVVDLAITVATNPPDPLGFGPYKGNIASALFTTTYPNAPGAQNSTQVFSPLRRNNYYVNGSELEVLEQDIQQSQDIYGDGYWPATIDGYPVLSSGHTLVTYSVQLDLSASGLKPGKTIVVQPLSAVDPGGVDYGRFIIQDVVFSACNCPNSTVQTLITVYDGVHNTGASPYTTAGPGTPVAIYFGSDSVSFDAESATDWNVPSGSFKRFFEVYVDDLGHTFTHERARFSTSGSNTTVNSVPLYSNGTTFNTVDLVSVSRKLRGNVTGAVGKINLNLFAYSSVTGTFDGYLSYYDGTHFNQPGPLTTGKIGEVIRFYDNSNVDYIDIEFPISSNFASFTNHFIDIQILPSLELDEEAMLISTCQIGNPGTPQAVNQIVDSRQFGNVSEEQLSTSALAYIALPEKLLHFNGVVRGLDLVATSNEFITMNGGVALVNGEIAAINPQIVTVPKIVEVYGSNPYSINFALCVNSQYELVLLPVTDLGLSGTPTTNRIMSVLNVNTLPATYQIDSDVFSTILNDRKDLTVLYVINSSINYPSGTTVTLTSYDVRRFINDADSNLPAVLTNDMSQGNFKSLSAAVNWLKFNGEYQQQLQIKGTYTISSDPGLNGNPGLNIIGNGAGAALNFTAAAYISGVTFSNLAISTNSILKLNGFTGGTPVGPVVFNNCNITVTTGQGFNIGSNVKFNNCTFTYNYSATVAANDLVNAGSGMIYTNVGAAGLLQNLEVIGCNFTSTYLARYSFISLQFSNYTAVAENINLSNNTFISSPNVSAGLPSEDIRAVIAVTSTLASTTSSTYPLYPKVTNLVIDNNICNQDQMILIAGTPTSGTMSGAAIVCVNSHISKNVCGTIGYFVAANDVADFSNAFGTAVVQDKNGNLTISDNTCHLITNLTITGQWQPFCPAFTSFVTVATGKVSIINNTANWINVGTYGNMSKPGQGVYISGNKLSPASTTYLANYTNTVLSQTIQSQGINLAADGSPVGNTQSIIAQNTLVQSNTFNTSGTATGPYYYTFGISAQNNAIVVDNIVNNVVTLTVGNGYCIYLGAGNSTMYASGNQLTRGSQNIYAYIGGGDSSTASGHVVNNYFDSITIDGTVFNDTNVTFPTNWNYTNNTNQVSSTAVPIYAHVAGNNPAISGTLGNFGSLYLNDTNTFLIFQQDGTYFNFPINFKLSDVLPPGVKLLHASVGLTNQGGGSSTSIAGNNVSPSSSIFMSIIQNKSSAYINYPSSPTVPTSGSPLSGTILDVALGTSLAYSTYTPGSSTIDLSTGPPVDFNHITYFLNIDMSNISQVPPFQAYSTPQQEQEFVVAIIFNNVNTAAPAPANSEVRFSPIVMHYAWV